MGIGELAVSISARCNGVAYRIRLCHIRPDIASALLFIH